MRVHISSIELNNLGYVVAIANIRDKHDRSAPSHYHWKILKCRMIIFSNSAILASPDRDDLQRVHIIFNKSGGDYDKLNSLLMKFSLVQDGGIRVTTSEVFQMCFHYTMTAKVAPTWNSLGENYLVNNRSFLTIKGPQESIQYKVFIKDEHILILDCKAVKINLMTTEEVFMPGEWIRVLPSLNKAMIEDHYEYFPQISKFNCYKDLRRHWKNIHGYRLPEEDSTYYSIQFWRGEALLYPKMCVTRNFPIISPTPKPLEKAIIQQFLNCLNTKMSNFFDRKLNIEDCEDENASAIVTNKHSCLESQAISLCTQTQN